MEVMITSPAGGNFNFDSTSTSPNYMMSASTEPQGLGGNYFFSAPSSPSRASAFYRQISFANTGCNSPVNYENPEANFTDINSEDGDTDFAFDFGGQLETPSVSAAELFDGGKIKPSEPPQSSTKKILKNALSFRKKKKDSDQQRRDTNLLEGMDQRGRTRIYDSSNFSRRQIESKSASPSSNLASERCNKEQTSERTSSSWCGKWSLKRLLLFRSASEGHAPNKKCDIFRNSQKEDVKNLSFRSTDSGGGSVTTTDGRRRKKGKVSAHESHYKANRAAAEEMRRKTYLPYKQNLMGCKDLDAVVNF